MFRRLVLGPRDVFFAELLRPPLVRLVLLEFSALAHHALFLFNRERPEPVARLTQNQNTSEPARRERETRRSETGREGMEGDGDAHEIHDGHAPALREGLAADALPVERLVVFVVFLIVLVVLVGAGLFVLGGPVLRAYCPAGAPPAHEGDQLGDEVVDVEGAGAGFHRACFGGVHVGRGQEEGRVERRLLRCRHWKKRGEETGERVVSVVRES